MKTILAISGSLRAASTNGAVLRAIARLAPADVRVMIYDGLATLPHFSPELDTDTLPAPVAYLRTSVQAADAVIICTPEYAHGMPGSLKNALDWLVSSGEFSGKRVAVLSASPNYAGGERANASLRQTMLALNATIIEEASLLIPLVKTKLDASGAVIDPETERALRQVAVGLV